MLNSQLHSLIFTSLIYEKVSLFSLTLSSKSIASFHWMYPFKDPCLIEWYLDCFYKSPYQLSDWFFVLPIDIFTNSTNEHVLNPYALQRYSIQNGSSSFMNFYFLPSVSHNLSMNELDQLHPYIRHQLHLTPLRNSL